MLAWQWTTDRVLWLVLAIVVVGVVLVPLFYALDTAFYQEAAVGLSNARRDLKPLADDGDLSKGDPGLRHSPWSRVHSHQENLLLRAPVASQILFKGSPGVDERIVDAGDRWAEAKELEIFD